MLKYDPVEDTPAFQTIKDELEAKIIAKIGPNSGMGYCYLYWESKRDLLKKDYGIEWKSPALLNPKVRFD